jgi:hypothetical protein
MDTWVRERIPLDGRPRGYGLQKARGGPKFEISEIEKYDDLNLPGPAS